MSKCNKNGIKREGESCTLNNNCTYPNCKIPTSTELVRGDDDFRPNLTCKEIRDLIISTSKLHVEAALKEVSKKTTIWKSDEAMILRSYPLNNIK